MRGHLRRKRDAALREGALVPAAFPELALDAPLDQAIEDAMPDGSSSWAITPDLARLLSRLVMLQAANVLELGAGSSSVVIAQTLAFKGGGRLTSIEQSPQWCAPQWASVKRLPAVDADLIHAPPRPVLSRLGVHYQFDAKAALSRRGPFDLVLVDAPQSYFGRDGALPLIRDSLAPGALILVDDAGRSGEQWTVFRWLRTYSRSLRLRVFDPAFGGRGLIVLEFTGPARARFDPLSFLTGCGHAARLYRQRRALKSSAPSNPPSPAGPSSS